VQPIRRFAILAAFVAAASCTADDGGRQVTAPEARHPHFTITTSDVTCPDTISVGQSAQCTAYFYDEFHSLVSTTPTWGTNTSSLVSVSSSGVVSGLAVGSADVHATAGGVTGSKTVYVKPGISASIVGPSPVRKFDTCVWYVSTSGGTPPYTYSWTVGSSAGTVTGDTYEGYLIGSQANFSVLITDANGVQKTVTRSIIGSPTAPLC